MSEIHRIPLISMSVTTGKMCQRVYFGKMTKDGFVLVRQQDKSTVFFDNVTSQKSYNDNGVAIKARWDVPELSGKRFYENKTFRYISVILAAAIATGVDVWVQRKGLWHRLFESGARACYFDFSYINWEKINFSSDTTPRAIGQKIKVKKVDKARFSLRNEALNEPFGIYKIGFEYTESGKYKG